MIDLANEILDFTEKQVLDYITYDIHGMREIISGLRLGMVKRSIRDDFRTAEEALKDLERYRYISFLERKTLEYYAAARSFRFTNVSDQTALMCIDNHYLYMLEIELAAAPAGPLCSALTNEIARTNYRILHYPDVIVNPYHAFNFIRKL